MIAKMWNTFLDTTPRQWGLRISQCTALALAAVIPTQLFSMNFRSPSGRWVMASVAIHAAVWFSIVAPGGIADALTEDAGYEIEFLPVQRTAGQEVDAVFDETSDVVMRVPPQPKKKKPTEAERLLSKYKKLYVGGVANVEQEHADPKKPDWRAAKSTYRAQAQAGKIDLSKHLDAAAQLDAKNQIPGLSKDQLNQHLAQYQGKFQSCYESALLKDESLNGKVRFELKTGPTGNIADARVTFEGTGLPATRSELQSCLQARIREIHFPKTLAAAYNRTVHFQAVLSL
jgi:hypothetical protein